MKPFILAAAAALGLSELAPAQAQFVVGLGHPFGYRSSSSFAYRGGGFGFSFNSSRLRVGGFYGGFAARPIFVPPTFGYGFGGWGPGFGTFAFGPPVVAVPVPVPVPVPIEGVDGNFPDPEALPLPPPAPRGAPAPLPKSDYLVISPRKKDVMVPDVPRVALVPKPLPPKDFDPFKPPAKVIAEAPEADPKKEAARLVKLARDSFAAGDYGRAAEHFDRAITAEPNDAKTYFLHAQAKFASGQYAGAVTRIREGLARDPKWPIAAFEPTELYGDRPERFVLHLLKLKKTMGENPDEATLEFLLGYQLWFSGDKIEADKLFRAAEKRLPEPGPIGLFK